MSQDVQVQETTETGAEPVELDYRQSRKAAIREFERTWTTQLLDRHNGNVSSAARAANIDRVYLHRLLRRHRVVRVVLNTGEEQ